VNCAGSISFARKHLIACFKKRKGDCAAGLEKVGESEGAANICPLLIHQKLVCRLKFIHSIAFVPAVLDIASKEES
jgi:hypothetical protein